MKQNSFVFAAAALAILGILGLGIANAAPAQQFNLAPGGSVIVTPNMETLVTCAGSGGTGEPIHFPVCTIKSENGYFYIYNDDNYITYESSLNSALSVIKKLADDGLCNNGPAKPLCSIKNENGYFYVYMDGKYITYETSLNAASETIKKIKAAGACR